MVNDTAQETKQYINNTSKEVVLNNEILETDFFSTSWGGIHEREEKEDIKGTALNVAPSVPFMGKKGIKLLVSDQEWTK